MVNDPELNGKYLGTISQDFIKVCDLLKEAAYQLKVRGISPFPIFPIAKTELPIGHLLYEKQKLGNEWNYYISFLQEFVDRQLVTEENLALFQENYKNPDEYCCLFVVEPEFTNFVYIPYPED